MADSPNPSVLDHILRFCLHNRLIVALLVVFFGTWGALVAPFDWGLSSPLQTVAVDAIPDIGENQQIVFTEWMGRSPQDVEDQITYPLTVRCSACRASRPSAATRFFGFSTIYVIFEEATSSSTGRVRRVLEKLASFPPERCPTARKPALGPGRNTALGQVFWYTLEGRDPKGNARPAAGTCTSCAPSQDWYVRYYVRLGATE